MQTELILDIIQSFYDTVKKDVMIGYHFRFIEDFESHIPRIADFWNLQLNGEVKDRTNLPFKLIEIHKDKGIKSAEMGRWIHLFEKNLENFVQSGEVSSHQRDIFITKINHFREKIESILYPSKQK